MNKIAAGVLGTIFGAAGTAAMGSALTKRSLAEEVRKTEKFRTYYHVLDQWLILKQEGRSLENYFVKRGYTEIIIYGMGEMGNRLREELEHSHITVKYYMDSNAPTRNQTMDTVEENSLEGADVVVVTAMFAFQEIAEKLRESVHCPIISLEEVVFGM